MNLDRLVEEYVKQKGFIEKAEKRNGELKEMLVKAVDEYGEVDPDSGHKTIATGNWVLTRQRRARKSFNRDAAIQWAKDHGVWDEVSTTQTHTTTTLNEDKLLGYIYKHPEFEPVYQSFHTEDVTWAFMPPKPHTDIDY